VREITLTLVGMQYRVTPSGRKFMGEHLPFRIKAVREPENFQDENAIAIFVNDEGVPYQGMKLGYLRRQVAAVWGPEMDKGRLVIEKGYLTEVDALEGVGELLLHVRGNAKALEVGP